MNLVDCEAISRGQSRAMLQEPLVGSLDTLPSQTAARLPNAFLGRHDSAMADSAMPASSLGSG